MIRSVIAVALAGSLAACANHGRGNGNGGGGGSGVQIVPADAVLNVAGGATTLTYQVLEDGNDVTSRSALALEDATFGSFAGATFTAAPNKAGVTHVRAMVDGKTAQTSLTLRAKVVVIAPGAPQNAPSQFGGPSDNSVAPSLVYPPDGVLIPPNLNELEFQYTIAPSTTLFEIALTSPALDLEIYTPCNAVGTGCGFTPDQPTWDLLSQAAQGQTVDVTLRALAPSGAVGQAAARKLSFGDETLEGGLYYWAAASGAVNRYDFGLRGQKAESFYTPTQSGAMCVGCHALSRDGSRIAVGLNVPAPATLRVLDVATRATLYESAGGPGASGGSDFETLSPDGAFVLTTEGANLQLHDAKTGAAVGSAPSVMNGTMPDWSADGAHVVFARGGSAACPIPNFCPSQPGVDGASLYVADFNGAGFGAPTPLVQGGTSTNSYYPSFSPDGAWVAFNRSGGNSYDAPDARVMIAQVGNGTPPPIDLATVNTPQGNSWPKFAPFVQHFQGKTIFWLTFSSRRDYGLRLVNSQASMQIAQLWMVAVSPDDLTASAAGYPPFWLPFQDITTGNHIAQWTQKVARQPCSGSPDGNQSCMPGETCMNGVCIPTPIM
jgi:hypothetical protein